MSSSVAPDLVFVLGSWCFCSGPSSVAPAQSRALWSLTPPPPSLPPAAQDSFRNEMQISRRSFLVKPFFFWFRLFLPDFSKLINTKTPHLPTNPGQSERFFFFLNPVTPSLHCTSVTFDPCVLLLEPRAVPVVAGSVEGLIL